MLFLLLCAALPSEALASRARHTPRDSGIIVPPPQRHVPATPAPAPKPSVVHVEPAAPPPPPPASGRLLLDVEVGARAVHRQLSVSDDLFGQFYPHTQPVAVAPGGKLRYFPGAHVTAGPASWFGVYGHGDFAPALHARLPDSTRLDVTNFEAGGGLVVRYGKESFELLAEAGVLVNAWRFTPAQNGTLSLTYLAVRPALEARFNLMRYLALRAGADLRVLVSTGELQTPFPRAKGLGFRAFAGVIIPLAAGLELRATGEYGQYGLAMNSQPGDSAILGGSLDQTYGGTLALAYRL